MSELPESELEWAREYIALHSWRTAKVGDHSYVVRQWEPESDALFLRFVRLIREYGHYESYYRRVMIYLTIDGLKYWTMGYPLPITKIINRANKDQFFSRQNLHKIAPCDIYDIQHLVPLAEKERLSFVDGTTYYAAYNHRGNIMGFTGIKPKGSTVTLKSTYVLADYRKMGIGDALVGYQMQEAIKTGLPKAEAFCTDLSLNIYQRYGGVLAKKFANGGLVKFDLVALA